MTLSDDLKERIIIAVENCKFSDKKLMDIFRISKKTFYTIKKQYPNQTHLKKNNVSKKIRNTKITNEIKNHIANMSLESMNLLKNAEKEL